VTLAPYVLDEKLIAEVQTTGCPRLAAYPHPGIAVVVGRGGDPAVETRPELIARDGVPLLRRRGGGCAVVVDPGNLVVSLALPVPGIGAITAAFAAISARIAAALAVHGIDGARQAGVSDLAVDDRKVGGSCIWRTRGLLYYSTTLLVDPDWDLIDRYLPHPPREPEYRRGREHRRFLTSLAAIGHSPDVEFWAEALRPILAGELAALCLQIPT
jgi:lipoate---protein ligase